MKYLKATLAAVLCLTLCLCAACGKAPASSVSQPSQPASLPASVAQSTPAGGDASAEGDTPASVPAGAEMPTLQQSVIDAFKGKTWLVIGDSLTEHNPRAEKNYHDYIAEWLGLTVVNGGVSGTGYIAYTDQPSFVNRLYLYPKEVDFITVFGGANDWDYPLGEYRSEDWNTMYGAANGLFSTMTEQFPNTPIGIFTPTPSHDHWGEHNPQVGHVDAIITAAGDYSLPVLDLYRESGLRPWNAENSLKYFSSSMAPEGDGLHPNTEGQLVLAKKMLWFIVEHMG